MANPNPDIRGLGHGVTVAWDDAQVTDFIHSRVKGARYFAPEELSERPVLIRKPEVLRRTGLSYPTIWAMEKRGEFPRRVRILSRQLADAAVD